ncbi:hypothetical protein [Erythrobacter rubeus]|uniref:Uncharacterized protein n=1 Tax=Erythrobacter rubeus TaxID=2760803 RepID=A0ABR8KRU7_9SPHN|nr:hypothetical protein [Erythrobacter rubeus]MBD2841174.1 hypothetical protein [Erythrobacter rubeus]
MFFAKKFWTSKLGHASIASIAAMTVMVVFTSQFEANNAQANILAHPHPVSATLVEIA